MERRSLDQLMEGEGGRLTLFGATALPTWVGELGWSEGCRIWCVRKWNDGGPYAFRSEGVTVALRRQQAAELYVWVSERS